jgi:hypothetical protein
MATYKWYKDGFAMPHHRPGEAPFQRTINAPAIVAAGINGGMANTSDVRQSITTEFAAADVLQIFQLPLGFCVRMVAVMATTLEGAACTADIGCLTAAQNHLGKSAADDWMGTIDLNGTADLAQINLIADTGLGGSTYEGVVMITNGSADMTLGHTIGTAIFKVALGGFKLW